MLRSLRALLIPAISLAMLSFGIVHVLNAQKELPQTAPPATPPRSPFGDAIAATGMIEPQSDNILIGSALSGVVAEVFVPADQSGTRVAAGDPLFRLDDRQWRAQLAVYQAQLDAPRAQLARLDAMPRPEEVAPVRHRVEAFEAQLLQTIDARNRAEKLFETRAAPESELVQTRQAQQVAAAEVARSRAELDLLEAGAWEPDRRIVEANIRQIEAQIAQTQTDIDRACVRAPVDGVILQVNVRPGEYVGTPASKDLVVIGDMRQPRVRVDIDEHDIPRFRATAEAQAALRGDSTHRIPLTFVRIEPYVVPKRALTGANTERVDTRVLQVLYTLECSDQPIYVGQQVDVFIASKAE